MEPRHMAAMCPGANAIGPARLHEHRVAFVNDAGIFDGGVATIIPDRRHDVWGVLWEIEERHLPALDEWETYPAGYDRIPVVVEASEPVEALAYIATTTTPEAPASSYLDGVLAGARAHGLPPEYIERLTRWAEETA